jgi:hypothetical protein
MPQVSKLEFITTEPKAPAKLFLPRGLQRQLLENAKQKRPLAFEPWDLHVFQPCVWTGSPLALSACPRHGLQQELPENGEPQRTLRAQDPSLRTAAITGKYGGFNAPRQE